MPSPNAVKRYDAPAYYHVYNRGAGGRTIFTDSVDRKKFMAILERHLSTDLEENDYTIYDVELVAYCLMGNHFHLLLYIPVEPRDLAYLMKSTLTAYSMYFNKRHRSYGHLFQGVYKASLINDDAYLAHITRYIHLNPRTYRTYYWSSLKNYLGERTVSWVHPERVADVTPERYLEFLEDYEDKKALLEAVKSELNLN